MDKFEPSDERFRELFEIPDEELQKEFMERFIEEIRKPGGYGIAHPIRLKERGWR